MQEVGKSSKSNLNKEHKTVFDHLQDMIDLLGCNKCVCVSSSCQTSAGCVACREGEETL